MNLRIMALATALIATLVITRPATALTMNQFSRICESAETQCRKHPILNAYVGGALDLIAMLDEETDYLGEVYCRPAKTLFDVPSIIRYLETHQTNYSNKNAMLVLIRYLEEHGGC